MNRVREAGLDHFFKTIDEKEFLDHIVVGSGFVLWAAGYCAKGCSASGKIRRCAPGGFGERG